MGLEVQIWAEFFSMGCKVIKSNLALYSCKYFFWAMGCHGHPQPTSGSATAYTYIQTANNEAAIKQKEGCYNQTVHISH